MIESALVFRGQAGIRMLVRPESGNSGQQACVYMCGDLDPAILQQQDKGLWCHRWLHDHHEVKALFETLDEVHQSACGMLRDAWDQSQRPDEFAMEALVYAVVTGACRAALNAALADPGAQRSLWASEALRWATDERLPDVGAIAERLKQVFEDVGGDVPVGV